MLTIPRDKKMVSMTKAMNMISIQAFATILREIRSAISTGMPVV